ncbi:hypothetical protein GC173_05590 [bacterium]|nr:hypothetical protein [bacterium]
MHDQDLEIVSATELPDGVVRYRVLIRPLSIEREYHFFPATGNYQIAGEERTIKVSGHDMTSIIGKRVREFLESRRNG